MILRNEPIMKSKYFHIITKTNETIFKSKYYNMIILRYRKIKK